MTGDPLIEWARTEAARLDVISRTIPLQPGLTATARALQFLSDHAAGSTFQAIAARSVDRLGSELGIKRVAEQLEEWATYRESGIANEKPFEVRFRIEASSDFMEQAQQLLADRNVHVAAPIVLAGASLEEFLRSMQVDCGEPIVGKPGISAYADALRKADLLTRGDVKEITAWADLRNEAAHGHFDDLSRERTRIMVDGINFFISRHTTD
jgi:hypothetical protein